MVSSFFDLLFRSSAQVTPAEFAHLKVFPRQLRVIVLCITYNSSQERHSPRVAVELGNHSLPGGVWWRNTNQQYITQQQPTK